MVMAWDALLGAAVPGTARRGGGDAADPQALLESAALHALARRAGRPADAALPLPPVRPADAASVLPGTHWIAGDRPPIERFLRTLGERGVVAAPEAVPRLIYEMEGNPALWRWLPVLGETGRWIAGTWLESQGDRWAFARAGVAFDAGTADDAEQPDGDALLGDDPHDDPAAPDPLATWKHGAPRERLGWMQLMLERAPEAVDELIAGALSGRGEKADLRAQLVDAVAQSPGPMSTERREALLELALVDRAASVRESALAGLILIGAPGLAERLLERAERWITFEGGGRGLLRRTTTLQITFDLPVDPAPDEQRDGITPRTTAANAPSRLGWLSALPLAWWIERADATHPADLVNADVHRARRADLLQAWARRALVDRDTEWAAAIAAASWSIGTGLAPVLAPADAESLGTEALRAGDSGMEFLAALPHPWPPRVTRAFLQAIPGLAERGLAWWPALDAIAEHGDPALRDLLPDEVTGGPQATGALNRARATLDWRARLSSALDDLLAERPA